jgi:lipoprotein Spr
MVRYVLIFTLPIFVSCISSTTRFAAPRNANKSGQSFDTRSELIQASTSWMGCAYLFGGSSRNGIDCSGLVQQIFKQVFQIDLPRSTQQQYKKGIYVRRSALLAGDLVFFKNQRGAGIDHVGIYLGEGEFLHASTTEGVIISRLDEAYYRSRYAGARRISR